MFVLSCLLVLKESITDRLVMPLQLTSVTCFGSDCNICRGSVCGEVGSVGRPFMRIFNGLQVISSLLLSVFMLGHKVRVRQAPGMGRSFGLQFWKALRSYYPSWIAALAICCV
jgi:hypothetical protein